MLVLHLSKTVECITIPILIMPHVIIALARGRIILPTGALVNYISAVALAPWAVVVTPQQAATRFNSSISVQQDVVRLDVSVDDVVRMQIMNRFRDLQHEMGEFGPDLGIEILAGFGLNFWRIVFINGNLVPSIIRVFSQIRYLDLKRFAFKNFMR